MISPQHLSFHYSRWSHNIGSRLAARLAAPNSLNPCIFSKTKISTATLHKLYGIWVHQPLSCLLKSLFMLTTKKIAKPALEAFGIIYQEYDQIQTKHHETMGIFHGIYCAVEAWGSQYNSPKMPVQGPLVTWMMQLITIVTASLFIP